MELGANLWSYERWTLTRSYSMLSLSSSYSWVCRTALPCTRRRGAELGMTPWCYIHSIQWNCSALTASGHSRKYQKSSIKSSIKCLKLFVDGKCHVSPHQCFRQKYYFRNIQLKFTTDTMSSEHSAKKRTCTDQFARWPSFGQTPTIITIRNPSILAIFIFHSENAPVTSIWLLLLSKPGVNGKIINLKCHLKCVPVESTPHQPRWHERRMNETHHGWTNSCWHVFSCVSKSESIAISASCLEFPGCRPTNPYHTNPFEDFTSRRVRHSDISNLFDVDFFLPFRRSVSFFHFALSVGWSVSFFGNVISFAVTVAMAQTLMDGSS